MRKEAILTCVKLLAQNETVATHGEFSFIVSKVIQKLLVACCSEPDKSLRKLVLELLDSKFDFYLSQQSNIEILLLILNDSEYEIRDIVVSSLGRICQTNPSLIVPNLRILFSNLLFELKIASTPDNKEICCNSITNLVKYTPSTIVKPLVDIGISSLSPLLEEPQNKVVASCLKAIGEIGKYCGRNNKSIEILIPRVISIVQEFQTSSIRQDSALHTLSQLLRGIGYVIEPFLKYPNLIGTLTDIIKQETNPSIRVSVFRLWVRKKRKNQSLIFYFLFT